MWQACPEAVQGAGEGEAGAAPRRDESAGNRPAGHEAGKASSLDTDIILRTQMLNLLSAFSKLALKMV